MNNTLAEMAELFEQAGLRVNAMNQDHRDGLPVSSESLAL
jgi:hypothetical protein